LDCSGVILTDQMKRFLIEIIATKSDYFSTNTVLGFLLKIEVSINYENRIILGRNTQNALDQAANDNDLEELINGQEEFLIKLNEFSKQAIILIRLTGIFPYFSSDIGDDLNLISEVNNDTLYDLALKLQGSLKSQNSDLDFSDLGFSYVYMKQVFELLLPDVSTSSRESMIRRAKTRLFTIQRHSVEMGIENKSGKTIESGLDKAIESTLEIGIRIEMKSSSQAKINQDVKRFVKLYGIDGLISFSLINQSPFCKIEPLYPNLNNFILRINTSALL
jgi:hypothetical protein